MDHLILLMIGYHKEPITTGAVTLQVFLMKLHKMTLTEVW